MRRLALLTVTFSVLFSDGARASGHVDLADQADAIATRLIRVRSESPEIAAVISRASEVSATFRRLSATIDATDGLVYVDSGKCGHGVRACLVLHVQVAGPFRILHIKVDARRTDCSLIASIGHELQHAIEILSDPHVTDGVGAYSLFERIAPGPISDRGRFETAAATRAGLDVRREACSVKGR